VSGTSVSALAGSETRDAAAAAQDLLMMWTTDHSRQQRELVADVFRAAGAVPRQRGAVIVGGLPGAAKDALLEQYGVDRSQYLTIGVDDVLARMAARQLIAADPGRSPLAAADSAHGEAQRLAKRIALVAVQGGWNVILDVALASRPATESWTYALRFADYAVVALFADLGIEESVARSDAAYQRGEEAYRRGSGLGGRYIPPEAIRALAVPAVTAVRGSVRWASGAEPASVTAGTGPAGGGRAGGLPGGAVAAMIAAFQRGQLSLDGLGLEFRARRWPAVPSVCPPGLEPARAALDDLEPYAPGSFDDVTFAYDLGRLSDEEYEFLTEAAGAAVPDRP
jgi:Zeta toxin